MTDENANMAEAVNDEAASETSVDNAAPMDMDAQLEAIYDRANAPEPDPNKPETEAEGDDADDEIQASDEPDDDADKPETEEGEQETPVIDPPKFWSADMKEQWSNLPPQIQEYVSQREREAQVQISRMGNELGRAKPVVETVAKYQHEFDRHGVSFQDGMERLMQAQRILDQNPLQGLAAIAQTYGINLAQAFSPQQQNVDPNYAAMQQRYQQMHAALTNQQREQYAQQIAEQRQLSEWAQSHLAEWADGKEYLDHVREDMAVLLQSGRASDFDDAYEKACWANPEIRSKITAQQAEAEAKERQKAEEKAAKEAKLKAKTNSGKRVATKARPTADMLDDDYLSRLYDSVG